MFGYTILGRQPGSNEKRTTTTKTKKIENKSFDRPNFNSIQFNNIYFRYQSVKNIQMMTDHGSCRKVKNLEIAIKEYYKQNKTYIY